MMTSERMSGFLRIAAQDNRLSTVHICFYLTLCVVASSTVDIHFSICRRELMRLCKIRGIATYHKCMRELHAFGYINYQPSFHPVNGSLVRLNDFKVLINV